MKHLQHIAELGPLLSELGLSHVVISPGSRNAPLIQLFTSSDRFHCYSIVDERSAGYVALGMARELGEPVIVLCTSGTAVLNLAPAVAEAYYQQIPLVVITADRPVESISSFNNQWIDQEAPYYAWSRGFLNFGIDVHQEEEVEKRLEKVAMLVDSASFPSPGPVHLNVVLEEPLYEPLPAATGLASKVNSGRSIYEPEVSEVCQIPCEKKLMILAGSGHGDAELERALETLMVHLQAVVIAEHLSNKPSPQFISHAGLVLAHVQEEKYSDFRPECVMMIGGQVVSKRLKIFLQSYEDVQQFRTDRAAILRLAAELEAGERDRINVNVFAAMWKLAETEAMYRFTSKLESLPYSNFQAVYRALIYSPGKTVMHLGNSTAVRYAQLCPLRKDLWYYSNRGTSGIDGCVSSAVGAAMVSDRMHFLVVGDLSFVYDSNALWNRNFPSNLRILVLNDGEGGIFRLLDGPDRMDFFEEFSLAGHPVSLKKLSEAFGRPYLRAGDSKSLEAGLEALLEEEGGPVILEADTRKSENSRIFKQFFE